MQDWRYRVSFCCINTQKLGGMGCHLLSAKLWSNYGGGGAVEQHETRREEATVRSA